MWFAYEVQAEAFNHLFPMMSLSKASLCQTEGLIKSNICWRHALAVVFLQGFYLCL
jgi:hypothetical protein